MTLAENDIADGFNSLEKLGVWLVYLTNCFKTASSQICSRFSTLGLGALFDKADDLTVRVVVTLETC